MMMRKLLAALVAAHFALVPASAFAQGQLGTFSPGQAYGNAGSATSSGAPTLAATVLNKACSVLPSACAAVTGYYNAAWFGVACDNSTDNTTALSNATAGIPATSGAMLVLPAGKCRFTSWTINKPAIIAGNGWANASGMSPTEFIVTSAGGGITVSSGSVGLKDFIVTSTIAAGSRTAAGIKVTGGPLVTISHVGSYGHLYGIWNQGQGNSFEAVETTGNGSHGIYFDGSVLAQNEVRCRDCESNGNTGDGIRILGPGTGIKINHPVNATNTGGGIVAVAGTGPVNDTTITTPEISTNTAVGVDWSSNATGTSLTIGGGLVERSGGSTNISIGASFSLASITGLTLGGGSRAISYSGADSTITGNTITGASVAGIDLFSGSSGLVLTGNTISAAGGTVPIGLKIEAGAGAYSAVNNDWSRATTQISGTVPGNSVNIQRFATSAVDQPFTSPSFILAGSGSGSLILAPQAAASGQITFPNGTTNFGATGGASQVVKQTSLGGALTVGQLACSDLSTATSACSATPAALTRTNDTNVTLTLGGTPGTALLQSVSLTLGWTGQLGLSRGGTNADLSLTGGASQVLKQVISGAAITVGQLACSDLSGVGNGCSNSGANPTASVGLSAVNGVATTYMRSDAAPALSQSITPTWTGAHIFSATGTAVSVAPASGTAVGALVVQGASAQDASTDVLAGASAGNGAYFRFSGTGNMSTGGVEFNSDTSGNWKVNHTGIVAGVFSSTRSGALANTLVLSKGHIGNGGTAPTLSSCGTSPSIAGSDVAGTVTMGTGTPTSCTITFANAYTSAPNCVVIWQATPLASQSYTVSTSAITLTQTATSSNKVSYDCIANST